MLVRQRAGVPASAHRLGLHKALAAAHLTTQEDPSTFSTPGILHAHNAPGSSMPQHMATRATPGVAHADGAPGSAARQLRGSPSSRNLKALRQPKGTPGIAHADGAPGCAGRQRRRGLPSPQVALLAHTVRTCVRRGRLQLCQHLLRMQRGCQTQGGVSGRAFKCSGACIENRTNPAHLNGMLQRERGLRPARPMA